MVIKKILPRTLALVYAVALMLPLTAFTADETDTNNTNTKRIPLEDVQRFSNAIGEIKKILCKTSG